MSELIRTLENGIAVVDTGIIPITKLNNDDFIAHYLEASAAINGRAQDASVVLGDLIDRPRSTAFATDLAPEKVEAFDRARRELVWRTVGNLGLTTEDLFGSQ